MKLPQGMDAEQYIALVKTHMPDFDRVACAETEEDFCAAVGDAVRHCLQKLEDRRKLLCHAGEIELSTQLADLLTQSGLPATAESHVNGHVDLVVEHFERGRYRMLGECKLDRGPKNHYDGTSQVLGYCGGHEKRALCIGFCKKPDVHNRTTAIRQHFEQSSSCHEVQKTEDHHLPFSFIGFHQHASGTTIEVLHISCNLFQPDGNPNLNHPGEEAD